ncbi:MAG: hypothetical protein ABI330_06040 [Caldimonas sp.]
MSDRATAIYGLGTVPAIWGGVSIPELPAKKVIVVIFAAGTVLALLRGLM